MMPTVGYAISCARWAERTHKWHQSKHGVSGLEQIGRHAAAHVTKPDESNPHDFKLLNAKA